MQTMKRPPEIVAVKDRARKAWDRIERKQRAALNVALECKAELDELDKIINKPVKPATA
jgi:hypothetical protein